jgi:hypothetical protein
VSEILALPVFALAWLLGIDSTRREPRHLPLALCVVLLGLGLGWLTLPPDPPPLVPYRATTSPMGTP